VGWRGGPSALPWLALGLSLLGAGAARAQSPLPGHYPPGQSGLRGAATPNPSFVVINFNRFFSNLERKDANGATTGDVAETRYANVTMLSWTTGWKVLGLSYGMLMGIPFSTGNLQPADADVESGGLALGDVLITPVSLYGRSDAFDYQFQFTLWTASGRFAPGATDNRGTGFWSLVYSLGGVWYPGADRKAWSVSAVARLEQNCEQEGTGIRPGNDIVIDAGLGRTIRVASRSIDLGAAGFAVWQLSDQTGGSVDPGRYRYFGLGPEAAASLTERLGLTVRAQWEFGTRHAVQGNNLWVILKYRL